MKTLLLELGAIPVEPTPVLIDNLSIVRLASNENSHQRTKHIDVGLKWLSQQHVNKNIAVNHVPGDEQKADILTKPSPKNKFVRQV